MNAFTLRPPGASKKFTYTKMRLVDDFAFNTDDDCDCKEAPPTNEYPAVAEDQHEVIWRHHASHKRFEACSTESDADFLARFTRGSKCFLERGRHEMFPGITDHFIARYENVDRARTMGLLDAGPPTKRQRRDE